MTGKNVHNRPATQFEVEKKQEFRRASFPFSVPLSHTAPFDVPERRALPQRRTSRLETLAKARRVGCSFVPFFLLLLLDVRRLFRKGSDGDTLRSSLPYRCFLCLSMKNGTEGESNRLTEMQRDKKPMYCSAVYLRLRCATAPSTSH